MKVECIEEDPLYGLHFGDIHTVVGTYQVKYIDEMITMFTLAEIRRGNLYWGDGWWEKRFKPLNRPVKEKVVVSQEEDITV